MCGRMKAMIKRQRVCGALNCCIKALEAVSGRHLIKNMLNETIEATFN